MFRSFFKRFRPEPDNRIVALENGITIVGGPVPNDNDQVIKSKPGPHSDYAGTISAHDWLHMRGPEYIPSDLAHPDKEGLVPVGASELMHANRSYIDQALQAFTHKFYIQNFDDHILELVRRVAHWMGPFPASRGHHHPNRGGLFTHSIGVALASLHMSASKNVTIHSTPRERDADGLAWQLIAFIGGLLHDIGKLNTTGKVYALSVEPQNSDSFMSSAAPVYNQAWEPMVEGFESWVVNNRVKSYFIDFDNDTGIPHRDYTVRYIMALVPRPLLAFIYNSNSLVRSQFEDFIRNPESAAQTPIFTVVRDADHMNVAQSMDPRRLPGNAELSSLVIRRFNEFANEARWNLPNSPFIYAHVQRNTEQGIRYYGVPFFIATETAISEFIHYLTTKPLLGVSFGPHVHEIVFRCLESAYVLNRTLDLLLPEQIPLDELQDYVPASAATLRFFARDVESVIKPVDGRPEDAIFELPVIPVNLRPAAAVMLSAPTLSFDGVPSSASAAVIPVAIQEGRVSPADPALKNDRAFMESFVEAHDVSEADAENILNLGKAKAPTTLGASGKGAKISGALDAALRERVTGSEAADMLAAPAAVATPEVALAPVVRDAKPAPKKAKSATQKTATVQAAPEVSVKQNKAANGQEKSVKSKDKAAAAPEVSVKPKDIAPDQEVSVLRNNSKRAPEKNEQRKDIQAADDLSHGGKDNPAKRPTIAAAPPSFGGKPKPQQAPSVAPDAEPWLHFYASLFTMDAAEARELFWAFVWLYLEEHDCPTVRADEDGKGGFILYGSTIPKRLRDDVLQAIQDAGMKVTFITENWPSMALKLDNDKLSSLFEITAHSGDAKFTVNLGDKCADAITDLMFGDPS